MFVWYSMHLLRLNLNLLLVVYSWVWPGNATITHTDNKSSNQLSLPQRDDRKTRTDTKYCTTNVSIQWPAWNSTLNLVFGASTLIYLGNPLPIPNSWFKTNIGIEYQASDWIPNMLVNVILACKPKLGIEFNTPDSILQAKFTQFTKFYICIHIDKTWVGIVTCLFFASL